MIIEKVNRSKGDFIIGNKIEKGNRRRLKEIIEIMIYKELRKMSNK